MTETARIYSLKKNIIDRHFRVPEYFRIVVSLHNIDINEKGTAGSALMHRACRLHPKLSYKYYQAQDTEREQWTAEVLETNTGIDVNTLDREGMTPLLRNDWSARSCTLALQRNPDDGAIDLLIKHSPAVILQHTDAEGRTPLSYAVTKIGRKG